MIALRFASGTAHAGLFHYEVSQREDRGHTLELIQTSGVQEHKLSNEAAIWIETPNCFFMVHLKVFDFFLLFMSIKLELF